jgi:PHS family inorganic phosphate transporter-like MFS transporter
MIFRHYGVAPEKKPQMSSNFRQYLLLSVSNIGGWMNEKAIRHNTAEDEDDEKLNRLHWRMIVTAGTGFFTDAYDLFVIGVVTALLMPIWHLSITQISLLNGSALISAAFGAIVFGWFSDKFGRKKMYGLEVLILFIGAIVSALSPSYTWLLISRVIVGFGIGGDYPSSAVVASECANRKNRGFIVLLVFAMQALGMIIGPLVASLLLVLNIPHEITWRILLGLGAIPAASVFYLRRTIMETPRYLLKKEIPFEVSRVISDLTGHENALEVPKPQEKLMSKKWMKYLLGTAGAWFLLDVAFYGNGISSVMIISSIIPDASLVRHTLISALIFLCFAVPGYFFAAKYVDRIGRKPLQMLGFGVMGICYLIIASIVGESDVLTLFVCIFGISFFFVNFGPNTTTFLIPSEIYPGAIRARAHGISAATGKLGAFVGAFFLPILLHHMGLPVTMVAIAIISFLGIFTTFLVPEMKGVALEN